MNKALLCGIYYIILYVLYLVCEFVVLFYKGQKAILLYLSENLNFIIILIIVIIKTTCTCMYFDMFYMYMYMNHMYCMHSMHLYRAYYMGKYILYR